MHELDEPRTRHGDLIITVNAIRQNGEPLTFRWQVSRELRRDDPTWMDRLMKLVEEEEGAPRP